MLVKLRVKSQSHVLYDVMSASVPLQLPHDGIVLPSDDVV